jgi:hypothetical protein
VTSALAGRWGTVVVPAREVADRRSSDGRPSGDEQPPERHAHALRPERSGVESGEPAERQAEPEADQVRERRW